MNFKQKLGYMCIGCLFTIAGYILASLGGITTHAQQDKQVIDEIVCRHLKVVNAVGNEVAGIGVDEDSDGIISVYNAAGKIAARIVVTENGGSIGVHNAAENSVVTLGAIEDGGGIAVYNAAEKTIGSIVATENGGIIGANNAAGKMVAGIGADKNGDGVIQSYKGGWRIH